MCVYIYSIIHTPYREREGEREREREREREGEGEGQRDVTE